jgi:hypothetical protein
MSLSLSCPRPSSLRVGSRYTHRHGRSTWSRTRIGRRMKPSGSPSPPAARGEPRALELRKRAHWITSCSGGNACRLSLCVVHRRRIAYRTDRGAQLRPLVTRAGFEPAAAPYVAAVSLMTNGRGVVYPQDDGEEDGGSPARSSERRLYCRTPSRANGGARHRPGVCWRSAGLPPGYGRRESNSHGPGPPASEAGASTNSATSA